MSGGIDFNELSRRVQQRIGYKVELISATGEGAESAKAGEQRAVVQAPLDMMRSRKVINERQFNAGNIFRGLWETSQSTMAMQAYDGMAVNDITYGPKAGLPDRVLEAGKNLHNIISRLSDPVRIPLLIVCCYGESVAVAYGVESRGRTYDAAVAKFTLCLELLAEIV